MTWSGNTYASFVHGLYGSICASTANSFTVRFSNGEEVVTTEKISSVMGIPRSNGSKFISEVLPFDERDSVTQVLCGKYVKWFAKNYLPAYSLIPPLRIIHIIFTHCIYLRKGNRIEVTPYMANVLYEIVTGVPMCLLSVVMHHNIWVTTCSQPCAAPLGWLL